MVADMTQLGSRMPLNVVLDFGWVQDNLTVPKLLRTNQCTWVLRLQLSLLVGFSSLQGTSQRG